MRTVGWYILAALGEIGGCFAFWAWLRLGRSALWTLPGILSLALFAIALTRVDVPAAGRAFAAYGGVYIVASILWLWTRARGQTGGTCLARERASWGAAIIVLAPHGQ